MNSLKRKKQTQKYELGTKEELDIKNVQNQKFQHQQTYQRIKKQINDLYLELPQDQFFFQVIEQTKKRIVLRIFYFMKNKTVCNKTQKTENWQVKKKNNKCSNIIEEFEQNNRNLKNGIENNFTDEYEKSYAIFTCIIQYEIYPFSPPYLFLTADNSLNKTIGLNDFRNIIQNLFQGIDWFPIYGLFDIFIKFPYFIQKINKNLSIMKSNFYHPITFTKKDIEFYAPGLKLYQGQFYDSKDALVGKYLKKIIGISFQNFIMFKKIDQEKITIHKTLNLFQIQKFKIQENEKRTKFTLKMNNKKEIRYKFVKQQQNEKFQTNYRYEKTSRDNYLSWMKICLFNSQLQKLNNTSKIKKQKDKDKSNKQVVDKRIHNMDRLSNESSFFTNSKQTKKLQPPQKQQKQQNSIQKQQILSIILQSLDLFLISQKYHKYQKQSPQSEIQEIFLQKSNSLRQQKGKKLQQKSKKLFSSQKIDLMKLEYQKLIEYKNYIENERKRIFGLM